MDIGSIFLILALFIVVVLFVARPFFEKQSKMVTREEQEVSFLMAERDRVINALQELDFDYTLHKIPEEDYPAQRAALLERGAEILRKMDELLPTMGFDSAESRIESAIAARRADYARERAAVQSSTVPATNGAVAVQMVSSNGKPDDPLEAMIAARRRVREEKPGGFCSQCGNPVHISDKFCPRCGANL
jgi:hypothetical protein